MHEELWCKWCARWTENPEVVVRFHGAPLERTGARLGNATNTSQDSQNNGPLAQFGRAGALQASGQEFEPPTVHTNRDSAGGHGRKPILKRDTAVANAAS